MTAMAPSADAKGLVVCSTSTIATPFDFSSIEFSDRTGSKPLKSAAASRSQPRLWQRFRQIEKLPLRERKELFSVIDAYLERHRLAQIAKAS